jgi:hypothetical protein
MRLAWLATAAGWLACCSKPEDGIRDAVRGHIGIPTTPDEIIQVLDRSEGTAVARLRVGEPPDPFRIYYLSAKDGAWRVLYEIREEFQRKEFADPEFERALLKRMGERMAERFNRAVNIKPGIPKTVAFEEQSGSIVAKVWVQFNASPEPGTVVDFQYGESHRFKQGAWSYESYTLLQAVPRKEEK